jgi:hypothetical protein
MSGGDGALDAPESVITMKTIPARTAAADLHRTCGFLDGSRWPEGAGHGWQHRGRGRRRRCSTSAPMTRREGLRVDGLRVTMIAPLLDALARAAGYRSITTHGAQSAVARLVGVAPAQVSRAHRGEVGIGTVIAWCETAGLVVELRVNPQQRRPPGEGGRRSPGYT